MVDRLEDFREQAAGWFLACDPGEIEAQLDMLDHTESLDGVCIWEPHENESYESLMKLIFDMQQKLYETYLRGFKDGRKSHGG